MSTVQSLRRSHRVMRRTFAIVAALVALALSTGGPSHAVAGAERAGTTGSPVAPAPVLDIGALFPGAAWAADPVVISGGDASLDQFALAPGSEQIASPQNDLVGFAFGRTAPLDDVTFAALTGPGGLFDDISPANGTYAAAGDLLLDDFRSGMQITFIEADGAFALPTAAGNSFVVAVEYADPRFPAPPSGNFANISKAHRLEIRQDGYALVYVQYTGSEFGVFQSTTVVADTCLRQRANATEPCGFLFATSLAGVETEGIVSVGVELYEVQGEFAIADRVGEWPGEMPATDAVQPGTVGIVEEVPAATTSMTTTTTTIVAAPPTESGSAAPVESASPQSEPQLEAAAESAAPVAAGPDVQVVEQPSPAGVSSSSDDDDGLPLLPIGLVVAGLAVTGLGLGVARRAKPGRAQPPPPADESVLRFDGSNDDVGTTVSKPPTEADIAWGLLLDRNAESEIRVSEAAAQVTKTLLPHFVDFATISGEYAKPYRRAVTGMVLLREHESEMEEKLAIARIADFVLAIVNLAMLAKNLGKLAVYGVRWMRRPPTQLATSVVDPPIKAGIGAFTGPQPTMVGTKPAWFRPESRFASSWSEPRLGIDGEDMLFWQMERMADEVGENLVGVITREGGIESAVDFLRLAVVRKRGNVVLDAADVLRLERIVIQARNAQRGQQHSYRLDDLQWLFARNTPEGRDALRAAISELEVKGSFEATDIPRILSDNDVRLVTGVLDRPGLADAIADATGSGVLDVGTGAFGSVLGLPADGAAALPGTMRFGDVLDVPPVDPNVTGAFSAMLDLPGGGSVRVIGDGFGVVTVPPTVGPGRLLDPVLDSIPATNAGFPATVAPGQFFPWTAGRVDPSRTAAFGDVLVDASGAALFADGAVTVPPGTMSIGDAGEFASSLLAGERTGVVAGPGAGAVIAGLPKSTPVAVFGPGQASTPLITQAGLLDAAANVLPPGIQAVATFGEGYNALTGPSLGTLYDIANGAAATTGPAPTVWIGELRPAEIVFVQTGDLPAGTHVMLTDGGMVFVDPSQPMNATPDAPMPKGLAIGGTAVTGPLQAFPLSSLTPDGSWLDPKWIADQQRALGEGAEVLAGVKDVRAVLENLVDPSWMEHDFCLLGVDLDGGALPAQLAWITLSAGLSPFEFVTRTRYFFVGGAMVESYVKEYASDYVLMKDLVHDAVNTLVAIEDALPATIGVLADARDAVAGLAAEVAAFGARHPDWVAGHNVDFSAKLARDAQTVAQADQSLASLRHLQSLVRQLIPWVRSLVVAPDGSAVPAYTLAWPTSLLRISSTLLMLSDAFGRICLLAPAPATGDGGEQPRAREEQIDKRLPGSYIELGEEDLPDPEDPDLEAFSEGVNSDDPIAPPDDR